MRCTNITATVFSGPDDKAPQGRGAYGVLDHTKPGVALPFRFSGTRPRVRVFHAGKSVEVAWTIREMIMARVCKSLNKWKAQVNERWPRRNKGSDGGLPSEEHRRQSPNSDHNTGRAYDITHDPANGVDARMLAEVVIASRDPRVKYFISNRQIASGDAGPSPWKWRRYTGKNPHTMHVHLSVKSGSQYYDDARDWAMPGKAAPAQPSAPATPPAVLKRATVRRRSKGADVVALQKLLGLEADGKFGPATEAAVKAAQKKAKLTVDGIVGPYTWAALIK